MQLNNTRKRMGMLIVVISLACMTAVANHVPGKENVVMHWHAVAMRLMVDPGPIIESRAFAIFQAAIHDAVNGVDRRYQPYTADVSSPGASVDAAVATAAH